MLGQPKGGEREDEPNTPSPEQTCNKTLLPARCTLHAAGAPPPAARLRADLAASLRPLPPPRPARSSPAESMIRASLLTLTSGTSQSTRTVSLGSFPSFSSGSPTPGRSVAFLGPAQLWDSSPPSSTSLEGGRDRPGERPGQELRARAGRREAVDTSRMFELVVFFFKPGNIVFSSSCEEKYISMFSNKIQ